MSDLNSQYNRVVWVDIPVADLDRAAGFYRAVLNTEVARMDGAEGSFCVFAHADGNGGCLVEEPSQICSTGGILVYLNVNGRIQDAVAQAEKQGGKIARPIHAIGQHGFRALILDSEGNRVALHSVTDA